MPVAIGVALALAVGPVADVCHAATPGDPFERFNRKNFDIQEKFDRYTIGPIAYLYRALTPGVIGRAIHNIIYNLKEPEAFVNDLFQLRPKRAGSTAARFVLNSTVGLGGMIDVAVKAGLPFHASSFGDTMARYGVHSGPYLFLPLVGPSTVRDLAGNLVDDVLNPLHFVVYPHRQTVSLSLALAGGLDQFRYAESGLKVLLSNAADPYATLRSTYLQNRAAEISGETTVPATLPDLDASPSDSPPSASSDTKHVIASSSDQPPTLMDLQGGEHGQANAEIPGGRGQGQDGSRLGAQAKDWSEDCIGEILYAQAHWRTEGGRAQSADQSLSTDCFGSANSKTGDAPGQTAILASRVEP